MATQIAVEQEGGVMTITLDRPARRNAITFEMLEELRDALRTAEGDERVGCIVLTGAGEAFCAGDDIQAVWQDSHGLHEFLAANIDVRGRLTPPLELFADCELPVVAAVNGLAVGLGMDFAVASDIRIASDQAWFAQPYVSWGLMCDATGLWRLPDIVGLSKAAELLYTGDRLHAEEALACGLVSQVVPAADLGAAATAVARRIASHPRQAHRYIKEGLRRARGRTVAELPELSAFVAVALARLFETEEHRAAVAAFVARRG